MFPHRLTDSRAFDIARAMLAGFDLHYRLFREASAAAKQRFERAAGGAGSTFVQFLREGVWHIWIGFDHILFLTTLLLPLVILLVTHGVLRIPLIDSQGTVIFLFFIWVTSSQAILSLTRIRAVASWKVSAAMLVTLIIVVFTYLFAVESFTHFLYPNPEVVASYFKAAALARKKG